LQRTRQNVSDSDGTLVVVFGHPTGGTARTVQFCRSMHKPHILVDAATMGLEEAVNNVVAFIRLHAVERLNVAGPRASGEPRGYAYARALVAGILRA